MAGREQFWVVDFEFHLFRLVGHLHPCPPQLPIGELEEESVLADVEVHYFLVLVTLFDDLGREVNRLVYLYAYLRFDSHLSRLVATPPVQLPVAQQCHRVTLAGLDFSYGHLLLLLQVLKVLVPGWHRVVLVLALPEHPVFPVPPVVHVSLLIHNCVELPSCRDSLDLLALKAPYLCGFEASGVRPVPQGPCWVHEKAHYHASILSPVTE